MSGGSLCLLPQIHALAGPASFSARFKAGMARLGVEVHHDALRSDTRAILIIAGTRHIQPILQARRRGVRVVQRLNGINWIHRHRKTGLRHFLRAETGNLLLAFTRRFLADYVGVSKPVCPLLVGKGLRKNPGGEYRYLERRRFNRVFTGWG
ncbi:MAG: hypothetical protein N2646_01840 [Bellilinea sp.]|nr:hypothetical protein [Bellilinea sp.]